MSVLPKLDEVDFTRSRSMSSPKSGEKGKLPSKKNKTEKSLSKNLFGCYESDTVSWVYTPAEENVKTPDRKTYNNETVILGGFTEEGDDNNNSLKNQTHQSQITNKNHLPLPTYLELFPTSASTPKRSTPISHRSMPKFSRKAENRLKQTPGPVKSRALRAADLTLSPLIPSSPEDSFVVSAVGINEYSNPLLNGHSVPVQVWIDDVRTSYYPEVMSCLQTKSIAVEAAKSTKIASVTAVQMIRNVQLKVGSLQAEFERVERTLASLRAPSTDCLMLPKITNSLIGNIGTFFEKILSKNVFQADNENDLAKFEDNVDNILDLAGDLRTSVAKTPDLDLETLQEDIIVIKRYLLIAIRAIFDRLVKVIITNIEESKCTMMLKTNLNYIATLTSFDSGFASLSDAFCNSGAVRSLLLLCLEEKQSSIRILALRALAAVCSSVETICQLEQFDGIEILKDILMDKSNQRLEQELREAVSVLTQVTAPWHGHDHKVERLKEVVDPIVESVTTILENTECCQTLLLCAACLNNLSRLEPTSIYSIMSYITVFKLKDACIKRGPLASIFLYEQVTAMIFNMSLNKKSHSHLSDRLLIQFLTNIFEDRFHDKYESRAENDALKRTIKYLLHIFSRLIHESNMGQEILANNMVPIFSRVEQELSEANEFSKDISYINRKLNESLTMPGINRRYLSFSPTTEHKTLAAAALDDDNTAGKVVKTTNDIVTNCSANTTGNGSGRHQLMRQISYV